MGFSQLCQYRRDALPSIGVAHLWWVLIKNLFKIWHLLLAVRSWGRGRLQCSWDRWREERKRETRQRQTSGEKGQKKRKEERGKEQCSSCSFHQSDLIRSKTNQCIQLGCFDWQQLHWFQMEMGLQYYPLYTHGLHTIFTGLSHPYHPLNWSYIWNKIYIIIILRLTVISWRHLFKISRLLRLYQDLVMKKTLNTCLCLSFDRLFLMKLLSSISNPPCLADRDLNVPHHVRLWHNCRGERWKEQECEV